jgi:hypothetical protein
MAVRLGQLKKSNDLSGKRTRDRCCHRYSLKQLQQTRGALGLRWYGRLARDIAQFGDRCSAVVKALCYTLKGRGVETRWGEWIFSIYLILLATPGHEVYAASNRNGTRSRKICLWGVERGRFVGLTSLPPSVSRLSRPVVLNLWYEYPWRYAEARLWVRDNNIGNGRKHKKKCVKIKTQKQRYEVLVYKERLMWKLSLDPPTTSHIIILMLFLFVLILCQAAIIKTM